jgi:hypothetical protein
MGTELSEVGTEMEEGLADVLSLEEGGVSEGALAESVDVGEDIGLVGSVVEDEEMIVGDVGGDVGEDGGLESDGGPGSVGLLEGGEGGVITGVVDVEVGDEVVGGSVSDVGGGLSGGFEVEDESGASEVEEEGGEIDEVDASSEILLDVGLLAEVSAEAEVEVRSLVKVDIKEEL